MRIRGIRFALGALLILVLAHCLVSTAQTTGAAQPAHLTAETTVELVGHLGGGSQGAVVVGNYGYTTLGGELAVLDLSDPANPTRVGYTMLPLPGDDLDIEGNYAYVIGNRDLGAFGQMVIVDVSVPTQPTVAGTLAVAGGGIDVSGSYAYLVGDSFQVVDISDPAHPALAGSCATSGRDVYLVGDYAYVAGGDLKVVNVADPDAPVQVGAAPASAYGVFVANGYAYVADFTSSSCDLRVFDVSNPATPQEVGSEELFTGAWSEAHDLYVTGSYAYVAGSAYIGGGVSYGGMDVVDISEPASPHSVGDYVAPDIWRTTAVAMTGNRAYLAAGSDGLRVLDVTDPANPTEAGALLTAWGDDVVVSNPSGREPAYAYLGNWGLGVVDISDPAYPVTVGRYQAPPPNYGENRVDRAGSYVYVSDVVGTLYVLDTSDPAQPVVAGSYEDQLLGFGDLDVDETGSYAYLAAGDPDDLLVLDVSDPAHITPAGTYDLPDWPTSLYISGTQAYVGDEEGLWVLDISDPTQPAEQGHVDISHGVQAVQGQGEYAYALNIDNSGWEAELSLLAIDVADPAQPIVAGSSPIASGAWAEGLYVSGDRAYVAGDYLWVLDIGDPASPALIATYKPWGDDALASLLEGFSGVYVAGEYIYAVGTDIYILKLSALALEVSPASITWLAETGGSDSSPRRLSIQSNGRPLTWTAQISPTVDWLEIAPPAGDTPATLTATAHISGLVVGQYTTSLVITSPLVSAPQQVPVTLRVAEEIFDVYLPLVMKP